VQTLVHSLVTLLVGSSESALSADSRRVLEAASPERWLAALELLAPHKVFPLLSHRLRQLGLWDGAPPAVKERLADMHGEVRARNVQLMLTVARILRLCAQQGEQLMLLKGILLADAYYPDLSCRPMSDIDVVAVRGRDQALFTLLGEAGFRPSLHHGVQEHSITFMNREGVFCDAHRRLPMFDREPFQDISQEIELRTVRGVKALALEPHAMVAHLIAHMHGHAREMGFVLLWIVDLGLVLRRHGPALVPAKVRRLLGREGAWVLLLRVARLLAQLGEPLTPDWQRAIRTVPPLSLGSVLRQRRIIPWGLPRPLGWVRLAAHELGLHRSERPAPRPSDLLLWPLDALTAKVAQPLARLVRH